MSQRDLLIEIGCEELPARYMMPLAEALSLSLSDGLSKAGISVGEVKTYATPRRIATFIAEVAETQPQQDIKRVGPAVAAAFKDGVATKAAEGFARSCGVSVNELAQEDTDKGAYLVYRASKAGLATVELLQGILDASLKRMDQLVPKRMRWGDGEASFVRPVHWLLARYGDETPALSLLNLKASAQSYGHRFHAPEAINIDSPQSYAEQLRTAYVLADPAERRALIHEQVLAATQGLKAHLDEDLLDEVNALVEWPAAIVGSFDEKYLELPSEVIVTTIQDHQRYFPVFDDNGNITQKFVTVANIASKDAAAVSAGNERVVRPRLEDAYFFYQQDLKTGLAPMAEKLHKVTFVKGAGSIADKTQRCAAMAQELAETFGADIQEAATAAQLCKADLSSAMVYEIPELQGVMGGYYAAAEGQSASIAGAISQHYSPQGPSDKLPEAGLPALTAFADKLDSLVTLFAIGLRPTSSKDPYGCRRAAYGLVRLSVEQSLDFDLNQALSLAISQQGKAEDDTQNALAGFIRDRLRAYLADQGYNPKLIEACLQSGALNLHRDHQRVRALAAFLNQAEAAQLSAANKRIRNILKDAEDYANADSSALTEKAELSLQAVLDENLSQVQSACEAGDFALALNKLSLLSQPIADFFEEILVNADDPALRQARLALIARFEQACSIVARFDILAAG